MDYYGDQPGRWRVSAAAGFLESAKSPWREFSFRTGGQTTVAPRAPVQSIAHPVAGDAQRDLHLEWQAVAGAESYSVEIDGLGSCAPDQWCSEVGKSVVVDGIKGTMLSRELPNAKQVRWRVWAVSGQRQTLKSAWQVLGANAGGNVEPQPGIGVQGPVYKVGSGVTPPMPTYRIEPRYPDQASLEHVSGTVLVRVIVAEDGTIKDAHIIRGVRDDLDQAALEAVKAWLFEPAHKDGQPVAVWSQIEVTFRQQ
jgi:TonB family protein